jgi:hypothetical protein
VAGGDDEGPGRTGPSVVLGLQLDPLSLCALGLRHMDGENALDEVCLDLVCIDVVGKADPVVEAPGTARASTDGAFALALLDLTGNGELVTDKLDVDVLALHAGKLRLDDVGVVAA